jgi:subtilisin-like proprotein convertase family protein
MINRISSETARNVMASNAVLKTFRLALSVTAEYTAYHGGVDNAVIAMNETMTRVNGVFEKDLAVHLNLIPNNSVLIYTDANTDPYSPATEMNNWNNQLQATLTSVIGEANYDIGHLFGADGGGGNAGCIGCICVNNLKGKGITSPSDGVPEGDTFDIDFVAHEMGHQLGGTHTFSENIEDQGTNVEPGSGSTIMGYAGVANYNVQSNSDDYFVYASIAQIQSNLANKACAVNTPLNNPVMSINAGADYNIPKGTAFILKAVGASANLAGVTYTWEQNDQATNLTTGAASVASASKLTGPTFRSIAPSTNPNRYMPSLDKVLAGTLSTQWESVSNVARTLNFVLTGRDNVAGGGQTKSDAMRVFVKTTSGPFIVTSQSAANTTWTQGSTQTVTWNVAGTTANTINTANVNILLSTDGGQTFTTVLAANTPNDGSETITVPNVAAPFCRIMVEAVGNIYYAVNSTPFSIGYTITTNCETFTNNTPLPVSDGTGTTSIGFGPVAQNTITIPAGAPGTISDVNVTVNATHTYISDLLVGVAHPDQTEIYLWGLNCTNQDGFNVTFNDGSPDIVCANPTNGTFKPYEELAQLNGKTRNGTWTLFAADAAAGDTGQINSWSLSICTQNVVAGVDEAGLTNFSLYPNPNNGNFTVEFTSATGNDINIKMHDMRGRQVYQRSYQNTGLFSGNVVTSGLETGVYLVTVQDGANKVVKRIVVE